MKKSYNARDFKPGHTYKIKYIAESGEVTTRTILVTCDTLLNTYIHKPIIAFCFKRNATRLFQVKNIIKAKNVKHTIQKG